MGDALPSRVIPSCLDASEPSRSIQRIPNVDATAPRKGAAKSSKIIVRLCKFDNNDDKNNNNNAQ